MHYEFLGKIMGKFFQKKIQIEWHAVTFFKVKNHSPKYVIQENTSWSSS